MRHPPTALLALAILAAPAGRLQAEAKEAKQPPAPVLKVGAVAYGPSAVTIWEGIRRYFARKDMPIDYVLYSNYDALVQALRDGHVDVAWNTPLAHARYHLLCGGKSQTLVMRDVDRDCRSILLVRKDAGIRSAADLSGKTLILGSRDAAEATVLPLYFLTKNKLDLNKVKVLSLDKEVDLRGNPCSSEQHVLRALSAGRGDAGIVSERLWKSLAARKAAEAEALRPIWTSPAFSHCVFTARPDLAKDVAERFTRLMLVMDPEDPLTADVMRLEGTRR